MATEQQQQQAEAEMEDNKNDVLFIKIAGTHRGYKKEFLSQNIPPMMETILICPVCTGIMNNATVCQGAITCDACTDPRGERTKVTQVINTVIGLDVKCPLLRQCEWSGKLSATSEHLDKCLLFRLKCPLACGVVLERSKVTNHKATECERRNVKCRFCKKFCKANALDTHMSSCNFQPIKCPDGCGVELAKRDAATHRDTHCPMADVKCPYGKYGCNIGNIKRKDLATHRTDRMLEHQDHILASLGRIETENANLKKELKEAKTQLSSRIDTLEKGVKK